MDFCDACLDDGGIKWTYDNWTGICTGVCTKCGKQWHPVAFLLEKYKGIRVEDLAFGNESYSCVLCNKPGCEHVGKYDAACGRHQRCTVEEFVRRYDFKG